MAPSAAPAPTTVWSSSINKMTSGEALASSKIFLSRSSNSPRYLVPAITLARSSITKRLFCSISGTSSLTIRWARPSTIAVLPTPGSPINTGLFLVRRLRIEIMRPIWFSRPTTGSSLPSRALVVISIPKWSSAGVLEPFFLPCLGASSA